MALKIVIGSSLASDTERERFHVEAEAAAHLQHPNIVPIYEIGKDDNCGYYSMPLLTGGTLRDRMAKQERWSHREAVQLMITVADAVLAAHRHGIIHRDLKPDNILLDEKGQPHISGCVFGRFDR